MTERRAPTTGKVTEMILTHKNSQSAHHTKFTATEHSAIGDGGPHHTKYTDSAARAAAVSNVAYGASWNGITTIAPSKNAVYDKIETLGGGGGATIATGSYSGNNGHARQITTGMKCTYVVILSTDSLKFHWHLMTNKGIQVYTTGGITDCGANSYLHATDGFVVDEDAIPNNVTGRDYYYWAISE